MMCVTNARPRNTTMGGIPNVGGSTRRSSLVTPCGFWFALMVLARRSGDCFPVMRFVDGIPDCSRASGAPTTSRPFGGRLGTTGYRLNRTWDLYWASCVFGAGGGCASAVRSLVGPSKHQGRSPTRTCDCWSGTQKGSSDSERWSTNVGHSIWRCPDGLVPSCVHPHTDTACPSGGRSEAKTGNLTVSLCAQSPMRLSASADALRSALALVLAVARAPASHHRGANSSAAVPIAPRGRGIRPDRR